MSRLCLLAALALPALARADSFENYTNDHLAKLVAGKNVTKIAELTPEMMVANSQVLPGISGTFVVVRTNEGRLAKLQLQPARQRISATESVPTLLIERYVTFSEGDEKHAHRKAKDIQLFDGFRYSLDLGQVVPETLDGDLHFMVEGNKTYMVPVAKAEMFLVTQHLAETNPKKEAKVAVGATFEPRQFSGSYHLHDDGRRSGILKLEAGKDGDVTGFYYSDKDGAKYEVTGKIGNPNHFIDFIVTYPRTVQTFRGWMFTGDGKAIAGSARSQERETGFYAVRQD